MNEKEIEQLSKMKFVKEVYPEPTTAEMLLWLVGNCEEIKTRSRGGSFMVTIYFRISYEKRMLQDFLGSVSEFNNLIKQAYEWAKKQEEQNAKGE